MAENEKRLYDILVEYIDFYNKIQKKYSLRYFDYNPKSSTELYKKGAEYLCEKNPSLIFGCWRSIDRKSVIPIIEKYNNLLCYPVQYEGQECSNNVLYFGATPNQQINIGIEYAIKNISPKVLLIGSDYVFPRIANKIMKDYIINLKGELIDEIYVSLDEKNFDSIVEKITKKYSNDKIVIMNTINGVSNKYFFETFYKYFKLNQINNDKIFSNVFKIVSFSLTENDIMHYNLEYIFDQYFVWNYSQTDISFNNFLNTEYKNNPKLLNDLIIKFKSSKTITDDPIYHVFLSFLFFINFIETYEGPFDSNSIRVNYKNYKNVKLLTPTGYLSKMDNNHLEQPVYILKVDNKKRFESIYRTSIEIKPNPWYNNFSTVKYECNNINKFMGPKYII